MPRIAFLVTRSDQVGGSTIHVRDLAIALQKDGYDVAVFMGGQGEVIHQFKSLGLSVFNIPSMRRNITLFYDFKAYNDLKKKINLFNPDLIATHSSKAGFLGRLVAWKLNIPVIFTAHGWAFTDGKSRLMRSVYKMLEKIVVPVTDKIITVSDYDRKLGIQKMKLSGDKIQTVYNGIPDITQTLMAHHDNQNPVNVVMVARFDQPKDQMELLKAAYDIENIHIHFVGDGPLKDKAVNLVEKLDIDSRVTFWGETDTVEEVLAKAQIFVLISNWEGFPISTLEAMRAGLPTIVSDVGGAAEAVDQGITGYAVKKGDIESLRLVLQELVDNTPKRKNMGTAARKRFERLYTFDKMYQKTLSVYNEVLKYGKVQSN